MAKTKPVKFEYYRSTIKPEDSVTVSSITLETMLLQFLRENHIVRDRFRRVSELDDEYNVIPSFNYTDGYIFCTLAELTAVPAPVIEGSDFSGDSINLRDLYEEFEDETGEEENQSRTLKNFCFILIKENRMVVQKTRAISLRVIETYLNWALQNQLDDGKQLVLEAPTKNDFRADQRIKELNIGDDFFSNPVSTRNSSINQTVSLQKRDLIRRLLDIVKESGSDLEDYIPEEMINISIKLKVKNREWQKHSQDEMARRALAVNLRHIPDDVQVSFGNGVTCRADDIRLNKEDRVLYTYRGYPDEGDMEAKMRAWMGTIG